MAEQNNNNRNQSQTSTNMITLWDPNGIQLRVSGMDSGLSLGFWTPAYQPDGSKKYPAEGRHTCIVQSKAVAALAMMIQDDILTAYASSKNTSRAIFTNMNRTNMLEMEVRDGTFYLHFHRNCDHTTHIPTTSTTFQFDVTHSLDKFDRTTGQLSMVPMQTDFYIFSRVLLYYIESGAGTVSGHGNRVTTRYANQKQYETMEAIANAVHATVPTTNTGSSYSANNGSSYSAPTAAQPQMPPSSDIDSLLDIMD